MTCESAPGRIRTCGLWLRRPTLYPAELRAQQGEDLTVRMFDEVADTVYSGTMRRTRRAGRCLSLLAWEQW